MLDVVSFGLKRNRVNRETGKGDAQKRRPCQKEGKQRSGRARKETAHFQAYVQQPEKPFGQADNEY